MDHAKRGADALAAAQFDTAIDCYTKAIAVSPTSPDYFINRSTAHQRSSPPDYPAALADAENAVIFAQKRAKKELIVKAQLRRAIALFGLERYGDAAFVFDLVKRLDPSEKTLAIWTAKVHARLKELDPSDPKAKVSVQDTPHPDTSTKQGQGPTSKPVNTIKHTWYQTPDTICFTLFAKGVPKDDATVIDIQPRSLSISFPLASDHSTYALSLDPLCDLVDVSLSKYSIMPTKIEVTLSKAHRGRKWHALEGSEQLTEHSDTSLIAPSAAPPSYPTSSRNGPKDWDKLATDLTTTKKKSTTTSSSAEPDIMATNAKEDDDDWDYDREEGDETNAFFKKLYASATPDVRRAMMKSFTESNGTALSTNWAEVAKAPVPTQPPDGMEAKPWEK